MQRRLAVRDRLAWLVALLALGVVAYIVFPLWLVVAAVVVLLGVPVLLRQRRRGRWRH
jgi:Flp pilus assembly protein TadB